MLNLDVIKGILGTLVSYDKDSLENTYPFTCEGAELALFTTIPSISGIPQPGDEVSLPGYQRRKIGGYGMDNTTPMFGSSAAWDGTAKIYKISNTGSIQMHAIDESVDQSQSVRVRGFGIFNKYNNEDQLLVWGPLVDPNGDPVTVITDSSDPDFPGTAPTLMGGSVPIFLEGDLTICFGEYKIEANAQASPPIVANLNNKGINSAVCIDLLNKIVLQGSTSADASQTFTLTMNNCQVGLFTTVPDASGANGIEVPFEITSGNNTIPTGYARKALYGNAPTSGEPQFGNPPRYISLPAPQMSGYGIANTDEIQMQSLNRNLSTTYDILGFGIFANGSDSTPATLMAWGPLLDTNGNPVTPGVGGTAPQLKGGSVPIFLPTKFKLLLSSNDSTGYVAVNSITLDSTSLTISDWSEQTLSATISPSNATDQSLQWQPSKTGIELRGNDNFQKTIILDSTVGTSGAINVIGADNQSVTCDITATTYMPTTIHCEDASGSAEPITAITIPRSTSTASPYTFRIKFKHNGGSAPSGDIYKIRTSTPTVTGQTDGLHEVTSSLANNGYYEFYYYKLQTGVVYFMITVSLADTYSYLHVPSVSIFVTVTS